ncbi:MAG TPA: TetR/AcrR family transcriptional regulator C-terminal domain-containing protein [Streptosporangiaceae bacterium]
MPRSADRPVQPPIWARPEPAARLPRFSRERIAQVALAIADAEGFAAVSMRRVAAELGSGTMSLYRYIATKADLAALLGDTLMGEAAVPDGELPGDWRAALAIIAHRTRDVYLRHPWAIAALQGEAGGGQSAPMGPNGLHHFEQSLAALAGAPFDMRGKLDLLTIVDDYVMGHVLRTAGMHARARTGTGPADTAETMKFIETQLKSGRFPQLQAMSEDPAGPSVVDTSRLEQRFELGLNALIDGAFRAWAYPATRID